MGNGDFYFIVFSYIYTIIYLIFMIKAKLNKTEHIIILITLIICSLYIFNIMNPPFKKHGRPVAEYKTCFSNQRQFEDALEIYYKSLPENKDIDELIKVEKDILIPNKYLRYSVTQNLIECLYIIKNSELLCLKHGSYKDKSPYFTDGKPLKSYDDYSDLLKKRYENKRQQDEIKRQQSEKTRKYCLVAQFLIGLSVIKTLVFILFK